MRTPPSRLDGVIFDLDGLLVDSEPLQFRAYRSAFLAHGLVFLEDDWQTWHEVGASAAAWLQFKGWNADAEAIRSTKKSIYEELIKAELTLKPGAGRLVRDLHSSGLRLCVASSSRIESIDACLERFDLRQCFAGLYSATNTPRKKPHPDVFELAIAQMGFSRHGIIVIEDSLAGLRAARAANLPCIVCPDGFLAYDPTEYQAATLLVSSLDELSPQILGEVLDAWLQTTQPGGSAA